MATRTVSATEFKAKCLALIDEVNASGDVLTITKRGQPVAVLGPTKKARRKSLRGVLKGVPGLAALGDIIDTSFMWKDSDLWPVMMETNQPRKQGAPKRRRKAS